MVRESRIGSPLPNLAVLDLLEQTFRSMPLALQVKDDPETFHDDWLIAQFGSDTDGRPIAVTTDGVRASEDVGDARSAAEFVVLARRLLPTLMLELLALRKAVYLGVMRGRSEWLERLTESEGVNETAFWQQYGDQLDIALRRERDRQG